MRRREGKRPRPSAWTLWARDPAGFWRLLAHGNDRAALEQQAASCEGEWRVLPRDSVPVTRRTRGP
jgi:hypothetical protein